MDTESFEMVDKRLKDELKAVADRVQRTVSLSDVFYNYYKESLTIIARTLRSAQLDEDKGASCEASVTLRDAESLITFLGVELDVFERNAATKWKVVRVEEHGLRADGRTDCQKPFMKLLDEAAAAKQPIELRFGDGHYFFKHNNISPIHLIRRRDIRIVGTGSTTLLCDASPGGGPYVRMIGCENVTFMGVSIDSSPWPYTLGEITRVIDGRRIIVNLIDPYPSPDPTWETARFYRGKLRDPVTGWIVDNGGDPRIIGMRRMGGRTWQVTLDDNALSGAKNLTRNFEAGQWFSIHPRARRGASDGMTIVDCRHLAFLFSDLHSADKHLVQLSGSSGVAFIGFDVAPAYDRVINSNADGFHCRSNPKGPYLEKCRVMHMNDDCMNLYTKLVSIINVVDDQTLIIQSNMQRLASMMALKVGSRVTAADLNTGELTGQAEVTAIEEVDWEGHTGLIQVRLDTPIEGLKGRRQVGRPDLFEEREYVPSGAKNYRAAMAIKAPFEHMLMNLDAQNAGWVMRDCELGLNRALGLKCKAPHGIIRNCVFHKQRAWFHSQMNWTEGTYPRNVLVTDSRFDRGVAFNSNLPHRKLTDAEVSAYKRHLDFVRVVDAEGRKLSLR
ncbi:MAG: hypothetical protein AAGI68_14980 [Planctomycetota bacterium]